MRGTRWVQGVQGGYKRYKVGMMGTRWVRGVRGGYEGYEVDTRYDSVSIYTNNSKGSPKDLSSLPFASCWVMDLKL